ncbi:hypothetical protein GCM10009733_103130 [Nonomuraea maheshkhaliensis]|uniref:Luciferase-like domain-containing protein n=1 Tax=Nonomuraea maheshkhaliensis TaxID=419590 RepID=A0ABN2HMF5_9ACTN
MVDQAVVVEETGFTGVANGEHHFTRYIVSAPELTGVAFGIAPSDLRPRLHEYLRLLLRLLREENVTWRGTFGSPLEGVTTTPRPVQRPHPTLWVGSRRSAHRLSRS